MSRKVDHRMFTGGTNVAEFLGSLERDQVIDVTYYDQKCVIWYYTTSRDSEIKKLRSELQEARDRLDMIVHDPLRVFLRKVKEANRVGYVMGTEKQKALFQVSTDRGYLRRDDIHQQYVLTERGEGYLEVSC